MFLILESVLDRWVAFGLGLGLGLGLRIWDGTSCVTVLRLLLGKYKLSFLSDDLLFQDIWYLILEAKPAISFLYFMIVGLHL